MTTTTNIKHSYGDTNIVTDVTSVIEQLSPVVNYFYNNLSKTRAAATTHSTQTDTLATTSDNGLVVEEGSTFGAAALTTPARVANITEIIKKDILVSGTQRAVEHFSGVDEFVRQKQKGMIDWSNAAERDIVRSAATSGASGTAAKMTGIISAITTNATAQTSGTVFSETILSGLLQLTFDNGNGEIPDVIAVGGLMKRKITGFSANNTRFIQANDNKLVNNVAVYESDFGVHKVVLHRFVDIGGTDATSRVLGVAMDNWAIAYLRNPQMIEMPKVGDADAAMVVGELTLEIKNEKTNFYSSGFLRSA